MSGNKANQSKRVGDTLFMVESSNTFFEANGQYFGNIEYVSAPIPDLLRHLCGSFWTHNPEGVQEQFSRRYENSPIKKVEEISSNRDRNGRVTQTIEIEWRDQRQEDTWLESLAGFFEGSGVYYDHATTLNVYEEGSNSHEAGAGLLNMYAEIKADYNFLEKSYEETIMNDENLVKEVDLPNFYNFLLSGQGSAGSNILRNSILSLDRRIEKSEVSHLGGGINSDLKPVSNYYEQWGANYSDYRDNSNKYNRNSSAMQNINFTKKEMNRLQELYEYKEVFPIFTTTEFTTETDAKLGTILENTKFTSQLRRHISNPVNAANVETAEVLSKLSISETSDGRIVSDKTTSSASKQERVFYDVNEFFQAYEPNGNLEEEVYFNEDILPGAEYRSFYNLMSLIANGKIEKIKKETARDYKEILEGKTAYNETVFYKVQKHDEQGNLLQTFNFTNTEELEVIKFVDTQVKYDRRYSYKIISYNLVIGSKYSFNSFGFFNGKARVTVITEPSVKMVEVPLFEKSVLIYDNPPIAPEIQLIPFRAVNDRIRMFLNSAVGRYELEPVLFSPEESTLVDKYKVSQDRPADSKKIKFETDDSVSRFILYKLQQPPESYQDFVDFGETVVVETKSSDIRATLVVQNSKPSSACYDDNIVPNKKYYYCARSQDYHGNLSYPTVVYELEMVDDSGSIYPVSRIYEFKKDNNKKPSKGVRRFIHIKPSLRNIMVDTEKMGIDNTSGPEVGQDVSLGFGDDSTWGKKFKVRLTSKTTGKKIDFNFTFKTKQDKSIIEET